jgi:cytochrome b561
VATLSILTFVRNSENLVGLVVAGLLSATSFVALFAWIRTMVLEHSRGRLSTPEEDDAEHHRAKSVAYGFVALVFAILLAGLIMNTASASPIAVG